MTKKTDIVATQAEPEGPRPSWPSESLGQLVRGMLASQGYRLD